MHQHDGVALVKLAVVLLALAVLGPLHGFALAPVVLAAAGAVGWIARWSHRADPPIWYVPELWAGRDDPGRRLIGATA